MRRPIVRIRMPKSARAWAKGSMWRELGLTILATTISIILTFGTAALLERCQRGEDRKMSALMVMSNIESFSRTLDMMAQDMAHRDSIATWMLSLPIEKLDSIPAEEMMTPINELIALGFLSHDKTAEGIFSNNIETWKNMGNFHFIDNVGSCFSEMNDAEKYWNDWVEEFEAALNNILEHPEEYAGERTHTKLLGDNVFRQKIESFHSRQYWLEYISSYCRYLNDKNMALIGIKKDEVMAFTDERTRDIDLGKEEPTVSDFRKPLLSPDSLNTLRGNIMHIDSIMNGKMPK